MDKTVVTHELQFGVRDYELDLQGIVNNANYMNYLEHARHEYLNHCGINFQQLHNDGYDAVVVRAEMDYKKSLKSGDMFVVKSSAYREGRLKIVFHQQIIRDSDKALILEARIFTACIHKNRPVEPIFILEKVGLI